MTTLQSQCTRSRSSARNQRGYKVSNLQQSTSSVDLKGVDFPHMSISLAPPKYPPWCTTIGVGRLGLWVRKLWKRASAKLLKMRTGWKLNGNLLILSLQANTSHLSFPRFKLHLRSRVGAGRSVGDQIPPLPLNKTVVDVFADFLRYLLECASSYIQDTHVNGSDFWNSVKSQIDFVLSHPNGWEGIQQSEMRRAAILAGDRKSTRLNSSH